MRIFSSARIAVIDADPDHRAALCSAMAEFGMLQILSAASFEEARQRAGEAPIDLCVVNAPSFQRGGQNGGTPFPLYPFDPAETPAILIAAHPTRETVRVAAAHGYRFVMPAPAVPRLVYRRIGSILQKVRRAARVKPPELAPLAPARELTQG